MMLVGHIPHYPASGLKTPVDKGHSKFCTRGKMIFLKAKIVSMWSIKHYLLGINCNMFVYYVVS